MRNLSTIVFLLLFVSCSTSSQKEIELKNNKAIVDNDSLVLSSDSNVADSILVKELASTIIHLLKEKKNAAIAAFIHPEGALLFSPYAYVSKDSYAFSKSEYLNLIKSDKKYVFGFYDGSGDPIEMSFNKYFEEFIYNVDYANAPQIAYNRFLGKGNSLNNIKDVFPNAHFVEFYYPGFQKKYQGMDWHALRLVFKKHNKQYYLVAIVHDQWTI